MNDYKYSTPSLEQWNGLWKSAKADPDVTNEEYDKTCKAFRKELKRLGKVGFEDGCDFYFRGDNQGDRTQYLEVIDLDTLTVDLIEILQRWLNKAKYKRWRILVVTYLGDADAILIYPKTVRLGKKFRGNWRKHVSKIVKHMKERNLK